MTRPLDAVPADQRHLVREAPAPTDPDLMLATLTEGVVDGPDWVFEPKLDGVRAAMVHLDDRDHLRSRSHRLMDPSYPELTQALGALATAPFVADAEIVAFEGDVTSFSRLQGRMQQQDPAAARGTGIEVFAYLFDLLWADGADLRALPQRTRAAVLERCVRWRDPLRRTEALEGGAAELLDEACRRGWEGLIAKRADAAYRGTRSRDWRKLKCVRRQELVIGGFTEPKGSRVGLGALLVGHWADGRLVYAGRVGTGFDRPTLEDLRARLNRLERADAPFQAGDPPHGADLHWCEPALVCEVGFAEWTRDGRLRHPRFVGLRHDKDAHDVVRERPEVGA